MSSLHCTVCNDTGSRDKSGDYLDCGHCDSAMQRKALNDWLASQYMQGAIAKVDSMDAWLVHQRALAMAPKQEAQEPVAEVSAMPGTSGFTMVVFKADDMPIGSKVYAAPAAANGAMTDEQILLHAVPVFGEQDDRNVRNDELIAFARSILAAAGPDAALVEALQMMLNCGGSFGRRVEAVNKAHAALAKVGAT